MTQEVLVGTDGSPPALAAVRWAADDAARRGAVLRVVNVIDPGPLDLPLATPPGFRDSLSERSRAVLADAAKVAHERVPGLAIETVSRAGQVRKELLQEASGAAELVLGTRGLGGFMGLVLGSVSMGVAGHADCPVMVAGNPRAAVLGEIVVGHDGSPESEAALEYAFEEALLRGARLRTVYAWQISAFIPLTAMYAPDLEAIYEAGRRAARDQLVPWREKYPQVEMDETTARTHPVQALSEASSKADLLVVGSRGHGALGSAVLGSVSHGVLHHAHSPVAVVRRPAATPPGYR